MLAQSESAKQEFYEQNQFYTMSRHSESEYVATFGNVKDWDFLMKVTQIKLFNYIHPVHRVREGNILKCYFRDVSTFLRPLDSDTVNQMPQEEKYYVLLQISITLQELSQRQVPYYIYQKQQIQYDFYRKIAYISCLNYNFEYKWVSSESLKFFKENLKQFDSNIPLKELKTFEEISKYFLGKFQIKSLILGEEIFNRLLGVNQENSKDIQLSGNSKVIKFNSDNMDMHCRTNQNLYIMKTTILNHNEQAAQQKNIAREVDFLERAQSDNNIVHCYCYVKILTQTYIIEEYIEYNLETYKEKLQHKFKLMYDLANGINYMHSKNMIHRDLKPQNLLVKQTKIGPQLIIIDFDRIKPYNNTEASEYNKKLTAFYMPPEAYAENAKITKAYDIWQFGKIALILFDGYKASVEQLTTKYDWNDIQNILSGYDDIIKNLIGWCLRAEPSERPEAQYVLESMKMVYEDMIQKQ